jgi:outer membrane biosynthesis protein TonB
MRSALAGLVVATVAARSVSADPSPPGGAASQRRSDPLRAADPDRPERVASKGLSLEQIRGVMHANAAAFNACLTAATRHGKQLHGPFLYDIEVDRKGKVTSVRPFQPSPDAAFDRCIIGVIKRARFPGGPASVEAPLVVDP